MNQSVFVTRTFLLCWFRLYNIIVIFRLSPNFNTFYLRHFSFFSSGRTSLGCIVSLLVILGVASLAFVSENITLFDCFMFGPRFTEIKSNSTLSLNSKSTLSFLIVCGLYRDVVLGLRALSLVNVVSLVTNSL